MGQNERRLVPTKDVEIDWIPMILQTRLRRNSCMGGAHYLDLQRGGFLSSKSAGKMHSGDRGDSVSRGAPHLGGAKWRK